MRKLITLVLIGLFFAGCESGTPATTGNYEEPFTGPTSINAASSFLAHATGGESPDNPVELAVKISTAEWAQLYQTIATANKFVSLDLSRCYNVPQTFSRPSNSAIAGNKIVSIVLPSGITEIGGAAFFGCTELREIDLPASLTKIGNSAFDQCASLTSVICRPTTPPAGGNLMFASVAADCRIKVPSGSVQAYKTTGHWATYADKIISM